MGGMMERNFVDVFGELDELKGPSPVRWRAVGNTGYAVRWPLILLSTPLIRPKGATVSPVAR
jgi:hypothetical protein